MKIDTATTSFTSVRPAPLMAQSEPAARRIVHRTRGRRHGPITRLVSPSDLGQLLKPFVFLDAFDTEGAAPVNFGLHPHSGIATLTWIELGNISYEDTTGATGLLPEGGVEWMQAGAGAWHAGGFGDAPRTRGFQLWVALPPEVELSPAESLYLDPAAIQREGPAAVLLGSYGSASSSIRSPASINYLSVRLTAGERWRYQPPSGHTVGWAAVSTGALHAPDGLQAGELAVFDASEGALDFHAEVDTEFMLGSAVSHAHDLVLGHYSVHTSADTLREGEANIGRIGQQLRTEGRLR